MLNNRELATALYIVVIVVVFVLTPKLRRALGPDVRSLIKAAFAWRLVAVYLAFLAWIAGWVALAYLGGLWNVTLLKDTLLVVATLGFPLLVRSSSLKSGPTIVRKVAVETVGLAALATFYVNLTPFPLWVELVLQPVLTLVVLLEVTARTKKEWLSVRKLMSGILITAGVVSLVWTTTQLATAASGPDLLNALRSLLLTVALPAAMLPFFYLTAFHAFSELVLLRTRWAYPKRPRRVAWAIWFGLRLRVSLAAQLTGKYNSVGEASGFRDGLRRMRRFRAEIEHKEH